jgi:hypothetical protein
LWPRGQRANYYDRQGFPIPGDQGDEWVGSATRKWAALMVDRDYIVVAQDELPDGSMLSTVWLGLDHGWFGPPLFFETMRFKNTAPDDSETWDFPNIFGEPGEEISQDRYPSEEEALAAHHEIVRRLRIREGH